MSSSPYAKLAYKVADISLADFGRKDLNLAEVEMPGLMAVRKKQEAAQPFKGARIAGSLHMTVQTAVLIETLTHLGANVRWCSCNIFSTQDHAAAAVASRGVGVFAWKGETLQEYWECTLAALLWPEDDGKGHGPDLIVDDGGDMTMLVHEGYMAENRFAADGTLPDPNSTDNAEMKIVLELIAREIKRDPQTFHKLVPRIQGVSEETTTGVHRLQIMAREKRLLFAAINVNDSVTKSKFDNIYGCQHSLPDALMRATDVMLTGKRVLICGFGDVGKGCAKAMKGLACIVYVSEIDPICAVQACMEGYQVVAPEDVIGIVDVVVTATGNVDVVTLEHMKAMKHNSIVCNIGHFDNEIQVERLMKAAKRENIKPQVDLFTFPETGKSIILLAEGRLVNLGCAMGHPSFVMSMSFTNQVLAQLELWTKRGTAQAIKRGTVVVLPKVLDEEVARLHLEKLGAKLTVLTKKQREYIDVVEGGALKADTYRY